ncbi:MAG TPA: hypothetical protein VFS43_19300 [Polyangiaceae bacterium]|nr:hypothetical protein [Polyangiaceae bacterium]
MSSRRRCVLPLAGARLLASDDGGRGFGEAPGAPPALRGFRVLPAGAPAA